MSEAFDIAFSFLYSGSYAALLGAFIWGVFSVILSPCGVAILPLVVGYIENSEESDVWSAFKISLAFCSGIVVNLLLIGALVVSVGAAFGGYEVWLTIFVGLIFIVIGLHLMGILHIQWIVGGSIGQTKYGGLKGALILGTLSGLAIGPCSFAYATPILTLAIMLAGEGKIYLASAIILSYSIGYGILLIFAGTGTKWLSRFLNWQHGGKALRILNFICGFALIAGGIYFLWNVPYSLL
ncbi:MAG: cytochrome C biogenesis protein [Synergistaceae bacterium]|nr:cytochrome C biogenesis protein [Synergistaceae bacterium]